MPPTISQGDWYARGVSSLATASPRDTSEPAGATPVSRARRPGVALDALIAAVLGAALIAIVFVATGGTDLGPNTWVEIALLAAGAVGAAGVILIRGYRPVGMSPATGAPTVALFAALAALTYLSIA